MQEVTATLRPHVHAEQTLCACALHARERQTPPNILLSAILPDQPPSESPPNSGARRSSPGPIPPSLHRDPRTALGALHFGAASSVVVLTLLNSLTFFGPNIIAVGLAASVGWRATLSWLQRASNEPGSPHARWHESVAYAAALPPTVLRTMLCASFALLSPTTGGAALVALLLPVWARAPSC